MKLKLPSGKEVKIKTPSKKGLEEFESTYSLNNGFAAPIIEIGKCKKCGTPLMINLTHLYI